MQTNTPKSGGKAKRDQNIEDFRLALNKCSSAGATGLRVFHDTKGSMDTFVSLFRNMASGVMADVMDLG
jgi:hypothetical protein